MTRPFARLNARELLELLRAALTVGGHRVPSIEACEEYAHLTPLPPMSLLYPKVTLDPSPEARRAAASLEKALPSLRDFWLKQVFVEADRRGGQAGDIVAARSAMSQVFATIDGLELALRRAVPVLEIMRLGPQEQWHPAALAFHNFFQTVTVPIVAKPYGLQGPVLRFVAAALEQIGWGRHTQAAIRACLTRKTA